MRSFYCGASPPPSYLVLIKVVFLPRPYLLVTLSVVSWQRMVIFLTL